MSVQDLEHYRSKMIAVANKILKDRDLAEDVAQEAMLSEARSEFRNVWIELNPE